MAKGNCKHGEFDLTEGCQECVAERQAIQEKEAEVNSPDNIAKRIQKVNQETNVKAFENIASSLGISMKDVTPPVSIVKVQYSMTKNAGTEHEEAVFGGRAYTYFTAEPLGVGDVIHVPVSNHRIKGKVVEINVPESEIAAFRDKVKTIPAGSKLVFQEPETQAVTGVGTIEDTGSASQPPLVSTKEPVQEEGPSGSLADAAEEAGAEVKEVNLFEEKPAALVTIETQVGQPANDLFVLYQEAARLLQVAKKRTITTNEDLKPATDDLAIIAVCKKAMSARTTEIAKPFKAKLDAIKQASADLMSPVLEADRLTRGQVGDFGTEQRRKAAEAERIEAEKLRLAREEEKLTGEHTVELGTAPSPPPVPERTRTDLGTLGGRANWKARVIDFKLLPDEYKLPNESMLNSFARSTKGGRPIPGVEFYDDHVITVRTRGN